MVIFTHTYSPPLSSAYQTLFKSGHLFQFWSTISMPLLQTVSENN